ncbi:hypothetical protein [Flavobacterium wongokense]|uniref:hypothetical protein n=1 Tax=Flavobacterium wongokense TaxID=2910674 RepID=UPI001F15AEAA|nr:hypothetical protein [Flavobacterium sp. WG47]MCF6133369.1 hypothetical protein [Flavobacterium sp. WG47]
MDFLLNKIVKFDTLNLIGVFRGSEGDSYFLLKVKKKKTTLDIVENLAFDSVEELKSKLDNKLPTILLLDGKGVLNKKIDLKNEADTEWLKNLDYKSIHYTSYTTSDHQFLSFCRHTILEELIEVFHKNEIQIIDFYIGGLTAVLVNELLDKSRLLSNETFLEFDHNVLSGIAKPDPEKKTENYTVGTHSVSNFHLPLYGAAINFYVSQNSIAKSNTGLIDTEELIYKKGFEKMGVFILVGFFCLLLGSYGLTQYLNYSNAGLYLENSYNSKTYTVINNLQLQKDKKLKILAETGFSSKKFISFYCYELTKSIPGAINLSFMEIYPLQKEIKKTERVAFDYKIILLKGHTGNETVFNDWIDALKNEKWLQKLEIVSIKRDKKNISYFELKITIKDV